MREVGEERLEYEYYHEFKLLGLFENKLSKMERNYTERMTQFFKYFKSICQKIIQTKMHLRTSTG